MSKIATPRTTEAATTLLERFAALEGELGEINANRASCIADVNARCDTAANVLIEERDGLLAVLEPWWAKNAEKLTEGKRKSIELGGCMIGSRTGAESLAIAGDEKALATKLQKRPWAADLVKVAPTLDKKAIRKALGSALKRKLAALGFSIKAGDEVFFVDRAEQEGTRA